MPSQRRVKVTGTLKDSGGFNLSGTLKVTATSTFIDETTAPHGIITTQPKIFEIFNGRLDIRLHESASDTVPYTFELRSETAAIVTFNAVIPNVAAIDWDDIIPTGITADELEIGANRVADKLTQEPYLSAITSATATSLSSITITNSFTIPVGLTGVTITPNSTGFVTDGGSVTGQINAIATKISRIGSVYTLTRITPGAAIAVASNSRFYVAPIVSGSVGYVTANATIATSGATTLAIAPSDFLSNNASVNGVIKSAYGTLSRNSGGVYSFTPISTLSSAIAVVANIDAFYVSDRPELPFKPPQSIANASSITLDADVTSNFVLTNAGDFTLNIVNGADAQVVSLVFTVQSSAAIALTPGGAIKIPDGLLSTFSGLLPSKSYLTTFKRVGGFWWCVSLSPPYS